MFRFSLPRTTPSCGSCSAGVLTRHGLPAHQGAADGVEALQVLERDYIDLIVSDIMMPQLDGYALVRGLRDSGSTIPVLMITARDGFQDMQFGFLAGADDYLVKPINVNELVLRINALLRRAQMVADRRQTLGTTTFEFDSFSVLTGGVATGPCRRRSFCCYTSSSPRRGTSSRGSSSWTTSGASTPTRTPAQWTCTSTGCATASGKIRTLRS